MNLLFLDTETGGLEAGKHSLLQIGMVAYKSDYGIIGTYEANLLYDIYHVTPQSLQFNGIDLAQLASTAKRPEVVVKDIITFKKSSFEDSNPILVGHNPWLDKSMLIVSINLCENYSSILRS
jgi:hypothetical protein